MPTWIEQHYNFGLFIDCVDSPADEHFLRQHEVDYCTGRSDDVLVQRWIERHYTFALFANCVHSATKQYLFSEDLVASFTARNHDIPVWSNRHSIFYYSNVFTTN